MKTKRGELTLIIGSKNKHNTYKVQLNDVIYDKEKGYNKCTGYRSFTIEDNLLIKPEALIEMAYKYLKKLKESAEGEKKYSISIRRVVTEKKKYQETKESKFITCCFDKSISKDKILLKTREYMLKMINEISTIKNIRRIQDDS